MKEGVALSQLADVLPPPAPGIGVWLPISIGVAMVAVAFFWWLRMRRASSGNGTAREALQRLAALRDAWQSHAVSDRETAYRLATLLRLGLGLPQLTPSRRPAVVRDGTAWTEILGELHTLRYRRRGQPALSPQCFDRIAQWLAAAQRGGR